MNLEKFLDKVQNKKKSTSILGKIVASLFVIAGVAVVVWKMSRMGKEQARLMHEKYVKEEEFHQLEENAVIQEEESMRVVILEEIDKIEQEITDVEIALYELEVDKKGMRDTIDRISSWDDVDKIVIHSK